MKVIASIEIAKRISSDYEVIIKTESKIFDELAPIYVIKKWSESVIREIDFPGDIKITFDKDNDNE